MKLSNKMMTAGIATLGVLAVIGASSAYAANKIGTVTGKDGDVKDKISMSAEVTASSGSHVTIKDTETGKEYQTSVGPSWYSGTYNNGDKVTVEGVETTGENENDHNFQVTKINDKVIRDSFEGKPAWAGRGGQGTGGSRGMGSGNHGQGNGSSFTDANGDGVCDNQ